MFKEFFIKKMLKSQGVPEDQAMKVLTIMEKNPDLFKQIAAEIQEKTKGGMNQTDAAMAVMQAHQEELRKIF
ncbi:MAG: hypothetical protein AAB589_01250 [Patescibacteria group bacterium]